DKPAANQQPDRTQIFLGAALAAGAFENVFGDTNALVRRSTFIELGGFLEDRLCPAEDWRFYADAVLRGARLEVVPESLFWYREMPGTRSNKISAFAGYIGALGSYQNAVPPELQPLIACAQGMYLQNTSDRNHPKPAASTKQTTCNA